MCEKSFTVNASHAEELFKLSQSKHLFLMEALWTRFLPIHGQVRRWLDASKIGDVRLVTSTLGFVVTRNLEDQLLNIDLAGGTILDLGVYNTALTQLVLQKPPRRITAIGQIGETGIDETVSATLSYENGAAAQFTCTFQARPLNQFTITGTKQSLH